MESFLRLVTLWHSMLVTKAFVKSKLSRTLTSFFRRYSFVAGIDCYYNRFEKMEGKEFSVLDADYVVFHSPYNKVIDVKQDHAFKRSTEIWLFLVCPRTKI